MDRDRFNYSAFCPRSLGINPRALGLSPRDLSGKTPRELADQLRRAGANLFAAADALEERMTSGAAE